MSKVIDWPGPNFMGVAPDRVATVEPYFTLPNHGSRIWFGMLRPEVVKVATIYSCDYLSPNRLRAKSRISPVAAWGFLPSLGTTLDLVRRLLPSVWKTRRDTCLMRSSG